MLLSYTTTLCYLRRFFNRKQYLKANTGFPNIVKLLLDYDASLHDTDSLEENAIHKAASTGDIMTLSMLLTYKGGFPAKEIINNKNVLGSTPLHNAAHSGHQDAAMLICQVGADVNLTGNPDF
jgi:ankyrin repeat protein